MALPMLNAPQQPTNQKWSDRLAFDLALTLEGSGFSVAELLKEHNLTKVGLQELCDDGVFAERVRDYRRQIKENGLTFKLKAKAQAEELLTTSWLLIHDANIPASVRADLLKSTVKWAGLEPSKDAPNSGGGNGVTININMGDIAAAPPSGMRVIDHDS